MVKEAATPPDVRKRKIEEVIGSVSYFLLLKSFWSIKCYVVHYNIVLTIFQMNYSNNIYFKKFGLEIGSEFVQVNAKVLKAPVLDVGGGQTSLPRYDTFLLKLVWFFYTQAV